MAHYEFRLPDVGEGVAEGEVVAWHVKPGDAVKADQEMVEVMTDKATVSIGAPRAGRIAELRAEVGEVVPVGSVLVVIDTDPAQENEGDRAVGRYQAPASMPPVARERARRTAERGHEREPRVPQRRPKPEQPRTRSSSPASQSVASAVGDIKADLPGMQWLRQAAATPQSESVPRDQVDAGRPPARKPLATPATRKLARDLDVDLRRVEPSGPKGRVTRADVQRHAEPAPSGARVPLPGSQQARTPDGGAEPEERHPFVGLRRRIAERMHQATSKPAAFTLVEEVEVDRLSGLVERLRPTAAERGVKLHYLPFVVKAVTLALKRHPMLNSMLDEQSNELVVRGYYHIGIATATEQGLLVPVVRHADRKSLVELAGEIQTLASEARAGTLDSRALSGSTFTVTSLGKRGGLLATPVLNHPEVGILGVHRIREKPVVRDGEIAVGKVMMISLSMDHRVVDGDVGAAFAYEVIDYLQEPERLLLEMH